MKRNHVSNCLSLITIILLWQVASLATAASSAPRHAIVSSLASYFSTHQEKLGCGDDPPQGVMSLSSGTAKHPFALDTEQIPNRKLHHPSSVPPQILTLHNSASVQIPSHITESLRFPSYHPFTSTLAFLFGPRAPPSEIYPV